MVFCFFTLLTGSLVGSRCCDFEFVLRVNLEVVGLGVDLVAMGLEVDLESVGLVVDLVEVGLGADLEQSLATSLGL